jgi:hypothetical protein
MLAFNINTHPRSLNKFKFICFVVQINVSAINLLVVTTYGCLVCLFSTSFVDEKINEGINVKRI